MDKEQEIKRGKKAKEILEDEIFVEAIQKIRQDLELQWLNSDVKNSEQRENIFLMRRMVSCCDAVAKCNGNRKTCNKW